MIRTVIFALILLLPGCRSEDPKTESTAPPAKPDPRALSIAKAHLLNQKLQLQDQLDQLINTTQLDPDNQLQAIEEANLSARTNFLELRKNHPRLQKLNQDLARWQSNLRSARAAKRFSDASQIEAKLTQIRGEIVKASKDLPEISAAQDTITRKEHEAQDLRRSLAEQSPEGQKIVRQLQALEAQLQTLSAPSSP